MEQKKETLTYNYICNLANQVLISLMPLITAPYVSRVLGVENIGHYSFVQSIASYFSMAAVLGTPLYGQRKVAQYRESIQQRSKIFWELVVLRALLTTLFFGIYYAALVSRTTEKALYLAVSLEIVGVLFDISWFFQGIEEFRPITTCNALSKLLCAVGIFTLVKSSGDIVLYAVLYSSSLMLGYLFLWKYIPRKVEKVLRSKLHPVNHIHPAILLFISQVAMQVYTVLDKTMIGLITGSDAQNGYYEQGQKLIRVLTALVTSVGAVMASRVANLWANQQKDKIQELMEHSFRLVYAISFPVMYGVALIATRFVPTFYGEGYDGVIPLLYILAVVLPIIASSNVVGIQYLIPRFGANGAAVGSVIAECCVTLVQLWIVRRQLRLKPFFKLAFRYFLLGLPMFLIGSATGGLLPMGFVGMAGLIVEGVLVYATTLWIAKDSFLKDLLTGRIL